MFHFNGSFYMFVLTTDNPGTYKAPRHGFSSNKLYNFPYQPHWFHVHLISDIWHLSKIVSFNNKMWCLKPTADWEILLLCNTPWIKYFLRNLKNLVGGEACRIPCFKFLQHLLNHVHFPIEAQSLFALNINIKVLRLRKLLCFFTISYLDELRTVLQRHISFNCCSARV